MTAQTNWPAGVIARYRNLSGATADVRLTPEPGSGERHVTECTGCPPGATGIVTLSLTRATEWAQEHAERCRAIPRPVTA
ncbi:hypothetical protein LRS74_15900 [Streptomyces sp. LX-29]|uniref:hypothetical protein n=1 Tax=Streptomyces sp. LX-29 TaxID=2900152 RepID=UPI00240D2BCF|nr:hypothetical protein [Streptomyces sp. LX-29]WFB08369.1 hypothetical protein LRS74_15900 [Streptomyces sp. LX-29]